MPLSHHIGIGLFGRGGVAFDKKGMDKFRQEGTGNWDAEYRPYHLFFWQLGICGNPPAALRP